MCKNLNGSCKIPIYLSSVPKHLCHDSKQFQPKKMRFSAKKNWYNFLSINGIVWWKIVTTSILWVFFLLFVASCLQVVTYLKRKEDTSHCHTLINLPGILTVWFWIVKEKRCSSAAVSFLYLFLLVREKEAKSNLVFVRYSYNPMGITYLQKNICPNNNWDCLLTCRMLPSWVILKPEETDFPPLTQCYPATLKISIH